MRLLYIDENDFNKKLRSLKIYCPIAYKQLIFKVKKELDASVQLVLQMLLKKKLQM